MDVITVRPLEDGEEARWHAAGPASAEATEVEQRRLAARAGKDTRCFLLAERAGAAVARLRGGFSGASQSLYVVGAHAAREARDLQPTAVAFATYMHQALTMDGAQVLVWDRPNVAAVQAVMQEVGFVLHRSKAFVERSLVGALPPAAEQLTYRSLAETGEQAFIETLAKAAVGDPFEDVAESDPAKEFQELVDYAADAFDPTAWRIASIDGDAVGIVLPQAYPRSPSEGSIFYMGVLPAFRGRGLGRALHAAGLTFLAEAGVTAYIGSTEFRNAPMIRIFEANGCPQTGVQRFYRMA